MKNRIIGLDILRIMAMLGIIGLHIIIQGGVLKNTNIYSIKYIPILLLMIIFYISINIFGLLSGYLNAEKKVYKNSRIVELIFIMIFWSFLITFLSYKLNIFNIQSKGLLEFIKNLFPTIAGNYWYITYYIFLFFMIPYMNEYINNISRQKYKKMLIILFVLLSIIPNLLGYIDIFKINFGYSPFWLIYCYLIGAYIKKYNVKTEKPILKLIVVVMLALTINYTIRILGLTIFKRMVRDRWMIDYISPLNLYSSVLLLLIFKEHKKNYKAFSKVFIYLSNMTFSVYIIHCHRIIYYNIINNAHILYKNYNTILTIIFIILTLTIIYVICCIIDEIRILVFKIFKINNFINYIGKKLDKLLN